MAQGGDAGLGAAVVDALGMELALDPGVEAHAPDRLHVARPRAVAQAVQHVDDAGRLLGAAGAAGARPARATGDGQGERQREGR